MSMKKYLEAVRIPDTPPGPFAVRLKYQLKQEYFDRKRSPGWYPVFSSLMALVFLALLVTFVVKPDIAHRAHEVVWDSSQQDRPAMDPYAGFIADKTDEETAIADEMTVEASETIDNGSGMIHINQIKNLDREKSYIIRRVSDTRNGNFVYFSEMGKPAAPRIMY